MRLDIKIFTGDTTEKYLKKLRGRAGNMLTSEAKSDESSVTARVSGDNSSTGHTFKKMIEAYENGMK